MAALAFFVQADPVAEIMVSFFQVHGYEEQALRTLYFACV